VNETKCVKPCPNHQSRFSENQTAETEFSVFSKPISDIFIGFRTPLMHSVHQRTVYTSVYTVPATTNTLLETIMTVQRRKDASKITRSSVINQLSFMLSSNHISESQPQQLLLELTGLLNRSSSGSVLNESRLITCVTCDRFPLKSIKSLLANRLSRHPAQTDGSITLQVISSESLKECTTQGAFLCSCKNSASGEHCTFCGHKHFPQAFRTDTVYLGEQFRVTCQGN